MRECNESLLNNPNNPIPIRVLWPKAIADLQCYEIFRFTILQSETYLQKKPPIYWPGLTCWRIKDASTIALGWLAAPMKIKGLRIVVTLLWPHL
jgi:hypothetical protein